MAGVDEDECLVPRYGDRRKVEFGDPPKTSTGKVQKFRLREKEWAVRTSRIQ